MTEFIIGVGGGVGRGGRVGRVLMFPQKQILGKLPTWAGFQTQATPFLRSEWPLEETQKKTGLVDQANKLVIEVG